MRLIAFTTLALGFGLSGLLLAACSNTADDCAATASCGGSAGSSGSSGRAGSAGSGASGGVESSAGSGNGAGGAGAQAGTSGVSGMSGGEGGGGGGCKGEVAEDPTCWATEEHGVFVSSDTGDDATGDGTREKPFARVSKGIEGRAGKNVYVCQGANDYADKLTIGLADDGVRIYGGFECDNWTHDKTRYPALQAPAGDHIGLRIDGLQQGAVIENIRFIAANATNPGESSYGAFIVNSKNVTLRRVQLTAGNGAAGLAGVAGIIGVDGLDKGTEQDGTAAVCSASPPDAPGGKWTAAVCGSKGGSGGPAAVDSPGGNGFGGTPKQNITPSPNENGGAGATGTLPGTAGTDGSSGTGGAVGAAAAKVGIFSLTGYATADGKLGLGGNPGQGGGGGGGSAGKVGCAGASGGAGGLGGCGGGGGASGRGGGASIGLFSWASTVLLEECDVSSGTGGAGGTGGKGGSGGFGANGGDGGKSNPTNSVAKGGDGGDGGDGGNGGSGSGGSGGPSFALVYSGTQPAYELADTTLTAGVGGAAGPGGSIASVAAFDGSIGASAPSFQVP